MAGWLVDWLTDWLIAWLADWLPGWPTDWLPDWLTDWLTDWQTYWVAGWLTNGAWQASLLSDLLAGFESWRSCILHLLIYCYYVTQSLLILPPSLAPSFIYVWLQKLTAGFAWHSILSIKTSLKSEQIIINTWVNAKLTCMQRLIHSTSLLLSFTIILFAFHWKDKRLTSQP